MLNHGVDLEPITLIGQAGMALYTLDNGIFVSLISTSKLVNMACYG